MAHRGQGLSLDDRAGSPGLSIAPCGLPGSCRGAWSCSFGSILSTRLLGLRGGDAALGTGPTLLTGLRWWPRGCGCECPCPVALPLAEGFRDVWCCKEAQGGLGANPGQSSTVPLLLHVHSHTPCVGPDLKPSQGPGPGEGRQGGCWPQGRQAGCPQ